jgi:hypothetical protein
MSFVALVVLQASLAFAGDWEPIATELIKREKPGYGGLCGVVVDRANGQLFVDLSDRGVYRSANQGKTWEKHGDIDIKGRTETPGCLQIDPTGESKRMLMPLVYGSPIALGATDSPKWQTMHAKSTHVDWCALNWSGDLTFVLTLKHESGGLLLVSRDGGATFDEVGKNFGPAWVFDVRTAVAVQNGIVRTTDAGKSFAKVADFSPIGLPRWQEEKLFWLTKDAVINSPDAGATFVKVCDIADGRFGPVFGGETKHMFVLTGKGIVESTDAGASWSKPIEFPQGFEANGLTWLDFDPRSKSLYLMRMSSDLYRLPTE